MNESEPAYGHIATISRTVRGSGMVGDLEEVTIKRVGRESVVRLAASRADGFRSIVRIEPVTKTGWVNAFGRGRL